MRRINVTTITFQYFAYICSTIKDKIVHAKIPAGEGKVHHGNLKEHLVKKRYALLRINPMKTVVRNYNFCEYYCFKEEIKAEGVMHIICHAPWGWGWGWGGGLEERDRIL